MKREVRRQRRLFVVIAAFAAVLLALALPLFLAEDPADTILRGSSVRAADKNTFTLSEAVEIMEEPRVVVTRGTISLAQPNGAAPLSSKAAAELLSGGKSVLILRDAELSIGAKPGELAATRTPANAPFVRALAKGEYRALLVERGRILIDGKQETAKPTVLENVDLRFRRRAGDRLTAKGHFELLGRRLNFETTIGTRDGDFEAKQLPVRGTIAAGDLLKASFSGLFALGESGRLIADKSQLSITDVPVFARWLGFSWPSELGLRRFDADGQLEWVRHVVNFPRGRFRLDDNVATGSLLVNTKGTRPLIDGTLAFDNLDVGALLAAKSTERSLLVEAVQGTAGWLPESMRGMFTDSTFPILRQLDVDLRVSAKHAVTADFTVNRAAAALSLRDGRVLLDLADLVLPAGGSGSLLLSIDSSTGTTKTALRGKLTGIRIENLSSLVLPHQVVQGPADLSIDLSGDGHSPETFLRSLNGRIGMRMANGAILNADPHGLVTSLGVNEPPIEGWGAASEGRSDLENLVAEIAFSHGEARIERLITERQGRCELALTGTVNFQGKHVDLNLFARNEGDNGKGESGEVPSVVNINGRWERPNVVKRPFPNKAANPVYLENQGDGSGGDKPEATAPRRG